MQAQRTADLPPGATAAEALAFIADADPERAVLEVDGATHSYADVDRRVSSLAGRLVEATRGGSGMVALRIEGTLELLLASLAVQRGGLTAVPLDPAAPASWLAECLATVGADLLLSDVEADREALGVLVRRPSEMAAEGGPDPGSPPRPDLAAVVFTSGSTGRPKGIMVPPSLRPKVRSQLVETLGSPEQRLRTGMLAMGTAGTTESTLQAFVCLGSTTVAWEVRRHGVVGLGGWLREQEVVGFTTVPTVLRQLLDALGPEEQLPLIQTVILSGETATWDDVARLRRHVPASASVVNVLGLTETGGFAVMVVGGDVPLGSGSLPVGHPMPNRDVRLLDEAGDEVPVGEVGEIVVEGTELALGYWQRPEETARVFVALPDGRTRVRTGDRGRFDEDGVLRHLGRSDHLVKVGGVRIELGQVELAIADLDGVVAAAARTYVDERGATRLAGYAVLEDGGPASPQGLRAALARALPSTMLPASMVVLDQLPQLSGGKVDRLALPLPTRAPVTRREQPQGELEELLVALFAEVLDEDAVGPDEDFFALGGDSLAAVEVLEGVRAAVGVDLPPSALVEAPTAAQLATLARLGSDAWPTVVPLRTTGEQVPLVVVHAIRGEVIFARPLAAAVAGDRPVYGLRASTTFEEQTIEALAARYVDELQRVRPGGPFILYGFSIGGYIAYAMAAELVARGSAVQQLVIGDIAAPAVARAGEVHRPRRRRPTARAVAARLVRAARRGQPDQPARGELVPAAELAAASTLLEQGAEVPPQLRAAAAVVHHGTLAGRYAPSGRLAVPTSLLVAESGPTNRSGGGGAHGWQDLVEGPVHTVLLPGRHADLVRPAGSGLVAEAIERIAAGR